MISILRNIHNLTMIQDPLQSKSKSIFSSLSDETIFASDSRESWAECRGGAEWEREETEQLIQVRKEWPEALVWGSTRAGLRNQVFNKLKSCNDVKHLIVGSLLAILFSPPCPPFCSSLPHIYLPASPMRSSPERRITRLAWPTSYSLCWDWCCHPPQDLICSFGAYQHGGFLNDPGPGAIQCHPVSRPLKPPSHTHIQYKNSQNFVKLTL